MSSTAAPRARWIAVLVAAAGLVAGLTALAGPSGAAGSPPPWAGTDPNEVGGLAFYDASGSAVTGGNLLDGPPAAAYVVGTTVLNPANTKATLYGYLPNPALAPGAWSGEALSASTAYPNASAPAPLNSSKYPLETGQSGDLNLAELIESFPNTSTTAGYSGVYELRLKSSGGGAANSPRYDYADIAVANLTESGGLVTGGTWSVQYTPAPTLFVTSTTLPHVAVDLVYPKTTLTAFGGSGKLTWSVSGGSLPAGLKLASSGTLTGKPTAVGTFSFTVAVHDSTKPVALIGSATLAITVDPMTVATTSLPAGSVGAAYKAKLAANGGKGAHTWSITAGTLPPGLKLAPSGTITGKPTTPGTSTFTVSVSDKTKPTPYVATAVFTVTVS